MTVHGRWKEWKYRQRLKRKREEAPLEVRKTYLQKHDEPHNKREAGKRRREERKFVRDSKMPRYIGDPVLKED